MRQLDILRRENSTQRESITNLEARNSSLKQSILEHESAAADMSAKFASSLQTQVRLQAQISSLQQQLLTAQSDMTRNTRERGCQVLLVAQQYREVFQVAPDMDEISVQCPDQDAIAARVKQESDTRELLLRLHTDLEKVR